MLIKDCFSYRHAESILSLEYLEEKNEIISSLTESQWVLLDSPKVRKRGNQTFIFTINQNMTNKRLEDAFGSKGWTIRPRIVSKSAAHLASDFRKNKVQVEVQFGNMARWYTDVFKFLLSYSADDIEVGVLVVPMQETAKAIDENVAYYERVLRELPHAKMGITLPIWVIGVSQ